VPDHPEQSRRGGEDLGPCGVDCSQFQTPPCTVAVCNTGQELGPINTCVVVPAPQGTTCDDGVFCTANDTCDGGTCTGGTTEHCGKKPAPCSAVICYEESTQSCDVTPVNDGTACTPTDLCEVNGVCHVGECVGEPKDCTFSPLNECNTVACEPATGKCVGVPPTPSSKTHPACSPATSAQQQDLQRRAVRRRRAQGLLGVRRRLPDRRVRRLERHLRPGAPRRSASVCTEGIPACRRGRV
jgi:hypothetical protein